MIVGYYEKEDGWGSMFFLVTEAVFKEAPPFPVHRWVFGSDIKLFGSDVILGPTVYTFPGRAFPTACSTGPCRGPVG